MVASLWISPLCVNQQYELEIWHLGENVSKFWGSFALQAGMKDMIIA